MAPTSTAVLKRVGPLHTTLRTVAIFVFIPRCSLKSLRAAPPPTSHLLRPAKSISRGIWLLTKKRTKLSAVRKLQGRPPSLLTGGVVVVRSYHVNLTYAGTAWKIWIITVFSFSAKLTLTVLLELRLFDVYYCVLIVFRPVILQFSFITPSLYSLVPAQGFSSTLKKKRLFAKLQTCCPSPFPADTYVPNTTLLCRV